MKTFIALLAILTALPAFARSEDITFAWSYPGETTNLVFKLYVSTNAPPVPPDIKTFTLVAVSTNLSLVYTNMSASVLTFFVTASNTVRQAESLPSNTVQLPSLPIVPNNFRLLSITIRSP